MKIRSTKYDVVVKNLNKANLFFIYLVFLYNPCVFSQTYNSRHYIIESPSQIDHRLVEFIKLNVEAYYENMAGRYFEKGWTKPLKIYYSMKQSDTQKLLRPTGYNDKVCYGVYIDHIPAVYTHRFLDNGEKTGWGTLFHEINHHFIRLNFTDPPAWFNEGLACFLGEQARVIKGKVTLGHPNPWREKKLRGYTEKRKKYSVKYLTSATDQQFYKRDDSYHYIRALFYWIYEQGLLDEYLKNVKQQGYDLDVLIKTVNKPVTQINKEILEFIRKKCYPAAYYEDGLQVKIREKKQKYFERALAINPDYHPARLELARYYYREKNYKKCQENLALIIKQPHIPEYWRVLYLMAGSYYYENDYYMALMYYQKVLEYSEYNEYKYESYYWIANCYACLIETQDAKQYYQKFLDENWEPDKHKKWVRFSTSYLKKH